MKQMLHRTEDKNKYSNMIPLRFCRYSQHLQNSIVLKSPVYWREKSDFELHCEHLSGQTFRNLYRISKRQLRILFALIWGKCYKNFFAILVQEEVTADYKFSFVSATPAGLNDGSNEYQTSSLHNIIVSGNLPRWSIVVSHCGRWFVPKHSEFSNISLRTWPA